MFQKRNGSALLMVVLIFAVIAILCAGSLGIISAAVNNSNMQRNKQQAYLTAKSVCEAVKKAIHNQQEPNGFVIESFSSGGWVDLTDHGDAYRLNVELSTDSKHIKITAEGRYKNAVATSVSYLKNRPPGDSDDEFELGGINIETLGILSLGTSTSIGGYGFIVTGGDGGSIYSASKETQSIGMFESSPDSVSVFGGGLQLQGSAGIGTVYAGGDITGLASLSSSSTIGGLYSLGSITIGTNLRRFGDPDVENDGNIIAAGDLILNFNSAIVEGNIMSQRSIRMEASGSSSIMSKYIISKGDITLNIIPPSLKIDPELKIVSIDGSVTVNRDHATFYNVYTDALIDNLDNNIVVVSGDSEEERRLKEFYTKMLDNEIKSISDKVNAIDDAAGAANQLKEKIFERISNINYTNFVNLPEHPNSPGVMLMELPLKTNYWGDANHVNITNDNPNTKYVISTQGGSGGALNNIRTFSINALANTDIYLDGSYVVGNFNIQGHMSGENKVRVRIFTNSDMEVWESSNIDGDVVSFNIISDASNPTTVENTISIMRSASQFDCNIIAPDSKVEIRSDSTLTFDGYILCGNFIKTTGMVLNSRNVSLSEILGI